MIFGTESLSPLNHSDVTLRGKTYATLLVRLCILIAPLVFILRNSMRTGNISGYILDIKNIFSY